MRAFVHGVPETRAIWRKVRAAVDGPSVALELPGFSTPRPEGFAATKDAYADWLVGELEAIGEPVDLVGHDWGAGITYRVAATRSDLLRSWVADVGGIAHPDYEWHDFAKLWQTPGDGEAFFEMQEAMTPADRAAMLTPMGMAEDDGIAIVEEADPAMGSCILDLYRSAMPNVHAHWGPWAPAGAPGMVLHPTEDPFADDTRSQEVAAMFGARFTRLPGAGHFWPSDSPEAAAAVLTDFLGQRLTQVTGRPE